MVSSPKAPNPYAQAGADQQAGLFNSQAQGIMNNTNETSPYGSVKYNKLGYETLYDAQGNKSYVPRYSRNVSLSPDQQKLLGLETQTRGNAGQAAVTASSQLANQFKTPLNDKGLQKWSTGKAPGQLQTSFANAGNIQKSIGNGGAIRQDQAPTDRAAIEQAMMGRYNENAAKSSAAEDAQLAARGLNPGGAQYGTVADTRARALTDASQQAYLASGQESRAAQDAYNQAQNQRFTQGAAQGQFANAAQQQQYGQNQGRAEFYNQGTQGNYQMQNDYAGFLNQLRQAQMSERMGMRNQLPNEIAAMMGMGQVTVPQFSPFSRGNMNQAQPGGYMQQSYQNQLAQSNANLSGMFGIGSAAIGLL